MDLLLAIKCRKTQLPAAVKSVDDSRNSASNSGGEDMGSTSTGSVEPNTHCPDLSSENKRLKKDNEKLKGELALAKKKWDKLLAFLRDIVNVGPDQINCMIDKRQVGPSLTWCVWMMTILQ
jgi:heat shock transcription factor, other eukaryote